MVAFVLTVTLAGIGLAVHLGVSDRFWWSEWLAIWPPVLWLFALIPLVLITLDIRRPRLFIAALGAVLIFMLGTCEWRSLQRRDRADEGRDPGRLRLITWNMDGGRTSKAEILEMLAAFEPDVCLLQETPDGSGSFQPSDLTGRWSGFHWLDAGDCGVLSRFPLEPLPTAAVGPWSPPQALLMTLPASREVLLINVRLMLPSLRLNLLSRSAREEMRQSHQQRLAQFEALAALIANLRNDHPGVPVILAGDFNTPAGMASLRPLRATLRDAWPSAGSGWGATILEGFPVARIDQAWTSTEARPVLAWVHDTGLSDHRLLVADLTLPSSPR